VLAPRACMCGSQSHSLTTYVLAVCLPHGPSLVPPIITFQELTSVSSSISHPILLAHLVPILCIIFLRQCISADRGDFLLVCLDPSCMCDRLKLPSFSKCTILGSYIFPFFWYISGGGYLTKSPGMILFRCNLYFNHITRLLAEFGVKWTPLVAWVGAKPLFLAYFGINSTRMPSTRPNHTSFYPQNTINILLLCC